MMTNHFFGTAPRNVKLEYLIAQSSLAHSTLFRNPGVATATFSQTLRYALKQPTQRVITIEKSEDD